MAFLDIFLPILIIVGLILTIWAKVSGQTIMDLIRDIRDFITETKDDTADHVSVGNYI